MMYLIKRNLLVYLLTCLTGSIVLGPVFAIVNSTPLNIGESVVLAMMTLAYAVAFFWIPLSILAIYNLIVIKLNLRSIYQRVFVGAALSLVLTAPFTYLATRHMQQSYLSIIVGYTVIGGIMGYFHYKKVEI
ncbi:hypothetical protein [Siphonobacter sp. SORGH_AS_0500]|uniref:hypothetical protein n=1 Tax=Siphonobacter sp. SORGH_AS_0500 TaxID=1864824 RepID=UPI002854A396|nr:hypothetical protein [Siphonobacter sp. SORGH_AS_0500]MDR6197515.1 hypothetical protein [Siphonobacter sp. SORGH_AS_0500]